MYHLLLDYRAFLRKFQHAIYLVTYTSSLIYWTSIILLLTAGFNDLLSVITMPLNSLLRDQIHLRILHYLIYENIPWKYSLKDILSSFSLIPFLETCSQLVVISVFFVLIDFLSQFNQIYFPWKMFSAQYSNFFSIEAVLCSSSQSCFPWSIASISFSISFALSLSHRAVFHEERVASLNIFSLATKLFSLWNALNSFCPFTFHILNLKLFFWRICCQIVTNSFSLGKHSQFVVSNFSFH